VARVILEKYDDRYQLSKEERTRYRRQIMLSGWGTAAQEKLKSTRVCVVGAGGIGSPIIYQLALLGTGTIIVCDHDDVELSNLNRQFLHNETRIGMNKALSARETLRQVNPHVRVIPYQQRVTQENIHEIAMDSDVIFDCVDDLETKFILSRYAVEKQIPHMLSAMIETSSFASLLHTPNTPCFHCLYDQNKLEEIRELKGAVKDYHKIPFPVSCPALFVTSGFACNEAIKVILGLENPAYNKFFLFNQKATKQIVETNGYRQMTYAFSRHFKNICQEQGFDWQECWRSNFVEELDIAPDPNCPVCGGKTRAKEKNNENSLAAPVSVQAQSRLTEENQHLPTTALLLENSSHMIIAMLGVLKSGKVYVTLDPAAPPGHLANILEESAARVIITDNRYLDLATEIRNQVNKQIPLVNINDADQTRGVSDEDLSITTASDQAASISYELETNPDTLAAELKKYVSQHLPEYMIPSYIITLDKIPLTPRGKPDRNALPEPEIEIKAEDTFVPPRNKMEATLVNIWSEVLGVENDKISIDSNFFDLGGHSLKATIIAAKIHKELNVKCPLAEVFRIPTIRKLSAFIDSLNQDRHISIRKVEKKEYYPLSSAQKRLYILHQMDKTNTRYNMPLALVLEGNIDKNRLESTFRELIRIHEVFRTSFYIKDDEPVQRIHPEVEFNLEYDEMEEEKAHEKVRAFIRPFDLSRSPLLRACLIRIGEASHVLMIDTYHIISDGESMKLLKNNFLVLYNGGKLPPLRVQYKDFAQWQLRLSGSGEIKKQEEYWMNRFKGNLPKLNLPTDYQDTSIHRLEKGDILNRDLENRLAVKLYEITTEMEITLYTILLTVFNIFLSRYCGQGDIVVGTPIAGRRHADLEKIVGMFVNMLAMRNFIHENKSFRDFLKEVKENSYNAYENLDYQYEELVNKLGITEFTSTPLCNVVFVMNKFEPRKNLGMGNLAVSDYPLEEQTVKFDLQLEIVESPANKFIRMEWNYPCALFKPSTIKIMAKHYEEILEQVVENMDIQLKDISISHDLTIADTNILQEDNVSFGF
jgi:molybdopterin/thiamine biosynthesis adenylyltransferase/acyl carrier protein